MENRYILATILIIIIVLFGMGFFLSDQQIDVAGCTAKWKLTPVTVPRSDLCPSQLCTASSDGQQHNAIVDALLCACDNAKSGQYANEADNKRIEEVVGNFFGYSVTVNEICDQPGLFLTKRSYG